MPDPALLECPHEIAHSKMRAVHEIFCVSPYIVLRVYSHAPARISRVQSCLHSFLLGLRVSLIAAC